MSGDILRNDRQTAQGSGQWRGGDRLLDPYPSQGVQMTGPDPARPVDSLPEPVPATELIHIPPQRAPG
jgi:hypothetical protein